jgi:TRAP-type C4-dicarboxylate transport system substrate-binding protein
MRKQRVRFWATLFSFIFVATAFLSVSSVQAAETITLKFANFFPPPAAQSKICESFIKELEARTHGKVKVKYFPGGQLLKAPGMITGVENGVVDMGMSHIQYTLGRMPVTQTCDLPLAYPSTWVGSHIVNDFYMQFKPEEWKKIKPLWFFTNSPPVLITTKPVRTLEDLKGMIIRAPGPLGDVVKALGGTPAPTPMVETYDALSKGVVQGAFVGIEALKTFRFSEVAKYATVCWKVGATYTFYAVMNKNSYDKLPEDVKATLNTLCGEYAERMPLVWNSIDHAGIQTAKEQGVEIIELSDEEMDKWVKAVAPVVDEYVGQLKGKGFKEADIKSWLEFINQRNAYWTEKQKEYRIKTITGAMDLR